jgi:hypothetical protein
MTVRNAIAAGRISAAAMANMTRKDFVRSRINAKRKQNDFKF